MAFHLEKQGTTSTPYVLADEGRSYLKLAGRSFHENIVEFFRDLNDWLDRYLATDFPLFTFDCEMVYFNSSTSKLLMNMLMKMDRHAGGGKRILVNWITTETNEIVREWGEDFREEAAHLEFNLVIREDPA